MVPDANVMMSALQMCSSTDIECNFATIEKQLAMLPPNQQHIVLLPECCLFFGGKDKAQLTLAKKNADTQQLQQGLASLAKRYKVYLIAGSLPIYQQQDKFANACVVFAPSGEQLAQYNKIHLFDVDVADSEKQYRESRYTLAGDEVKVVDIAGISTGLAICYDLRFPELFRALASQGATIITVPAAFTRVTGQAHWLTLLRARAIENQVYIIAAGQEGVHENGRETWGHSMIISPWGEVLAQQSMGEGIISAAYQEQEILRVRQAMPVASHNRFENKLKVYE